MAPGFSSAHIDEARALDELMAGLDGEPAAEPRTQRFVAGRRERLWEKNCVAIGLCGGFIEPLESTSIHLIQSGNFKLISMRDIIRQTALAMPTHQQFIDRHCRALTATPVRAPSA